MGEAQKQLRLWPGVAAVVLQCFFQYVLPRFLPEAGGLGVLGGLLCGLVVLVWWAFFSRAPRLERWGAIVLLVVAIAATPRILHKSIASGAMGMLFLILSFPVLCLALVVWAAATRRLAAGPRRVLLVAAIVLPCAAFALIRTEGITARGKSQFAWRWTPTTEQKTLARIAAAPPSAPVPVPVAVPAAEVPKEPMPRATVPKVATPPVVAQAVAEWPGFRGPQRDGVVHGVQIKTDWSVSPPVKLWHREVGPGWSSFAVGNGLIYTQEQRGEFEVVSCYKETTGEPVWTHRDATRFWESNAGAGPRATPILSGERVYTFGATGILNALNASDGSVVWTRNAASDTGAKVPMWGFTSSPLVVGDLLIVAAAGQLVAYDTASGARRWLGPAHRDSYSSPQLLTINGISQVVLLSDAGATSVAPADGKVLWEHPWPGLPILQPAVTGDGGVLLTTGTMGGGAGTRLVAPAQGPGAWTAREMWTSKGLKPFFNDLVVHKGYAYGFDGSILACIDLKDGQRKWKGGRYGSGQLLLLADQDVLLVLSEEGELALVAAAPGEFTEITKVPAIEGKTWNHPVLTGDTLLIRNGQEMAAFRLRLAGV
jgi:outer membrane protein assembly factor BamB